MSTPEAPPLPPGRGDRGEKWYLATMFVLPILLPSCAPRPASDVVTPLPMADRCHQLYLAAGSDGPKLLAVDAIIVDSTTAPPTRCGQLRSAHPGIKSSE